MSSRATRIGLFGLLLGGLFVACAKAPEPARVPEDGGEEKVSVPAAFGKIISTADLDQLAHSGVRKIEVWDRSVTPARFLAYLEEIVTDGRGHFSIEPIEPLTAVAPEWNSFQLLQRLRESYIHRYRDFAIRDEGLFAQNYSLTDLGEEIDVAGRACARYRAERLTPQTRSYELAVDVETGIVLRYEEFDDAGNLLSAMEYETYQPVPDITGVRWFISVSQEEILDWTWDLSAQLGVHLDVPRVLPEGYSLREAARVVDGNGDPWLRLTYLDGVEPLFYLLALNPHVQQAGQDVIPLDPPAVGPGTVTLFQLGAARAAQGEIGDQRFIAVGKVEDFELLDMIESALP